MSLVSSRTLFSRKAFPLIILLFALAGGVFALSRQINLRSSASTISQLEPENGVLAGNTSTINDTSVSNGKYIQFQGASLPLKDTNYPVPATNAYFVSPSGLDTNPGTQTQPLKTITKAASVAPSGATIVIREGTYREQVPPLYKTLVFQPYPHEKVWMKGSVVISNWTQDSNTWRSDNWLYRISHSCDANDIDSTHPYACYPEMVFLNGAPLTQAGSLAAVTTGTFFVDETNSKLYIGDDPSGKIVEATVFGTGLNIQRPGTIVRGLGFTQYASRQVNVDGTMPSNNLDNGAIAVYGDHVTLENNTLAYNALNAVNMFGSSTIPANDNIVTGNYFLYNGRQGLIASGIIDRILIEKNRFAYNAIEGWRSWSAAGMKILKVRDGIVRDNIADHNEAQGLWCDGSCYNIIFARNYVHDNKYPGIMYEISGSARIVSNVISNNKEDGLLVSGSSQVQVYNNTFSNNGRDLNIRQDPRVNTNQAEIDLGITWIVKDVVLKNNLISTDISPLNPNYYGSLLVEDWEKGRSGYDMVSANDHNALYRKSTTVRPTLIRFAKGVTACTPQCFTNTESFTSLSAFQTAKAREASSISVDNQATNPFLTNPTTEDFTLLPTSTLQNKGDPLPQPIADAINNGLSTPIVSAGNPIDIGALAWQNNL